MREEGIYKILDLYNLGMTKSYEEILEDNKFCRVMKERLQCLCLERGFSVRFLGDSLGLAYNICGILYLPFFSEYLCPDKVSLYQSVEKYCLNKFHLSADNILILRGIIFLILRKNRIPFGNEETIDILLSCIESKDRFFAKGVNDLSIEDKKKYRFNFEMKPTSLDKEDLHSLFWDTYYMNDEEIDKIYKYVVCSWPLDRQWKVVYEIERYFKSSLYWDIYENQYYANDLKEEISKGMEYLKSLVQKNMNEMDKMEKTKTRLGRIPEPLFKNADGNKDIASTEKYATLFVEYLKCHNSSNLELRSDKGNYINRAFVVFYRMWTKEGIVSSKPNGSACRRFLKEDCKLNLRVKEKPYSDFIRDMINDTEPNSLLDIEMKVGDFMIAKNKD